MSERDALDIDLYQARMLIGFHRAKMSATIGTMEAFVRKLPTNRLFLVACGIDRIINYIKELRITPEDIRVYKALLPEIEFDEALGNYLTGLDFKQLEIRAMQDGDIAFAREPFISIRGPVGMVQFIEKKVLSILNHDIRIASKAARIAIAARGRPVAEFGGRRGGDMMSAEAARAAYIGGFASTSNVLAYEKYGVPCIGTMGHVWVMSHTGENGEEEAYKEWSRQFPNSVYLPDTYHTYIGIDKIFKECKGNISGIRFDSGDILEISKWTRRNYPDVQLGATNDLNEHKIRELLNAGATLDWFGVGTEVISTPDAPSCNVIYKLVEIERDGNTQLVAKIADNGKGTLPGAKQVFRHITSNGYTHDTLGLKHEQINDTKSMLVKRCFSESISATKSRELFKYNLSQMPAALSIVSRTTSYEYDVETSNKLTVANINFINNKRQLTA